MQIYHKNHYFEFHHLLYSKQKYAYNTHNTTHIVELYTGCPIKNDTHF